MKKLFSIFAALLFIVANPVKAQLRLKNDGTTIVKNLWINAIDTVNNLNQYGVFSNLNDFGNYQFSQSISIYGNSGFNGTGCVGTSIGVKGLAHHGNYNYAVYGQLCGTGTDGFGAGVYGTVNNSTNTFDDRYAGYFDGPVGVTNGLRVNGGITTGSLLTYASPSTSENLSPILEGSRESCSLVDQLGTLETGCFYGTNYKGDNTEHSDDKYKMVSDEEKDIAARRHYGIAVEQLEKAFPELVLEDREGNKFINYVEMVPLLVQSIRELSAKVTALEAQLGISDPSKPVLKTKDKTEEADNVTLALPDNGQEATLNVYDLSGKLLRTSTVNAASAPDLSSYTHGLPTGTYAYSLTVDGKRQKARKVVVR